MKRRAVSSKRILVLCEGVTEEIYAKSLRSAFISRPLQRTVAIEVVRHKKNDPLSLLKEANERVALAKRERQPYTAVWLFFDHDNSPHLEEVLQGVESNKFRLAYSAISIEFWFILHFEKNGRAFASGTECVRHLRKLWPAYHKTKVNHFANLIDKLDIAVERAEELEKRNSVIGIAKAQPYTSVHHLISYFKDLDK